MNEHVERLKQVANLLDETQNGMAAVGVDKAVEYLESIEQQLAAAEKRAAELEQALRESTELMREYNEIDWAEDKELTNRIAANERLLGGKHE